MLNPYAVLVAIAFSAALFGGGLTLGIKWEAGRQAIENQHIAEAVDAANAASAEAIAKIKVTNKTVTNQLEKQIETNTVYRDCRLDAVSLQLLNQALTGSKSSGDLQLPRIDAPVR